MTGFRAVALFLLCSFLLCLAIFRGGCWGSSILAPVDIAPTLFSHYRYIDPNAGHVPANHYTIDQLTYDLPLQYTIYQAIHHGEIPWWDPYTYAGRPLLADAHINGTDPIRMLTYTFLPFVYAYNWNLILKSILTGLGMFVLLRHFRFDLGIALPLALTYQFAGCFAVFFGHPWIQASFAYYPFLWMTWSGGQHHRFWMSAATGSILCGLIFYSGNLQSHAYLPLFAACYLIACGLTQPRLFRRQLGLITTSGLLGFILASPVLFPEVEFFLYSTRSASSIPVPYQYLGGLLSLGAVFPWMFGDFRTLDLGKFLDMNSAAFVLFIGSSLTVVALLGCGRLPATLSSIREHRRIALSMILFYLFIASTSLIHIFYLRMAPFAVIGLTVLAGFGLQVLKERDEAFPKVALLVASGAALLFAALNAVAFIIYPQVVNRVRAVVVAHTASNPSFDSAPALRAFQIDNLPHEISFLNPETVIAFLGLLVLAFYLCQRKVRPLILAIALALNFLPVVHFFNRYIPHQPIAYWQRLHEGSTEQRRVASILQPQHLRIFEQAPGVLAMLFPNDMGHLYQAHTVHGYSALQPVSLFLWPLSSAPPAGTVADFIYRSNNANASTGVLTPMTTNGLARFHCGQRQISVLDETMNSLRLSIGPGRDQTLVRTDTDYPGWTATLNGQPIAILHGQLPFSYIQLPIGTATTILTYTYRPSYFLVALSLAAITLCGIIVAFLLQLRSTRKQTEISSPTAA